MWRQRGGRYRCNLRSPLFSDLNGFACGGSAWYARHDGQVSKATKSEEIVPE